MAELATPRTLQRLAIMFGERGIDRPGRLRLASDHAGRALRSSGELTEDEAKALIRRLHDLDSYDLRSTLRRLNGESDG